MSHPIFENSLWNAGSFTYDERDVILDDTFIKIGKKKSKIRLVAFPSFLIKIKVNIFELLFIRISHPNQKE